MINWRWVFLPVIFLVIWLSLRGSVLHYMLSNRLLRRTAVTLALRIPYVRNNLLSSFTASI